jgi:hypothetical protein
MPGRDLRLSTDAAAAGSADHPGVDHPDEDTRRRTRESRSELSRARSEDRRSEHANLRAAEDRELFTIRGAEAHMASEARSLARGLEHLEADIRRAEVEIQEEWRAEHWGRPSPPPPAWRAAPPQRLRRRRAR